MIKGELRKNRNGNVAQNVFVSSPNNLPHQTIMLFWDYIVFPPFSFLGAPSLMHPCIDIIFRSIDFIPHRNPQAGYSMESATVLYMSLIV